MEDYQAPCQNSSEITVERVLKGIMHKAEEWVEGRQH